ncbi:MAG: hypothetical protein A2848_00260 [Candidatus Magasanikbacteria bacterium RIFCSPHIGHO2_01_FULL_50_8]|uniref:Uncharacterized protein n=2 Tax=Candidatus Magasanikiibacteriota TaxID=1752731 RepID=A0A1F6LRY1_9BACT|nr:MAG: hypothetical protein A2848_00260 [Candidatus Magasanikbacteria bacterium RIFCSPHIGHO2_01_FULL_50_8]OGH67989.1 MAG: hypothetical protein A3C15_00790 [Candidatus Magasanikbacteria bacterium RIFCSPHIGHO2_02_FULL_50_9b]
MTGKPATAATDAAVSDFVTKIVRAQRQRLLTNLNFGDLFEQMKDNIFDENVRRMSDEEARNGVRDTFDEFFSRPEVESELIVLARTVWNPVKRI